MEHSLTVHPLSRHFQRESKDSGERALWSWELVMRRRYLLQSFCFNTRCTVKLLEKQRFVVIETVVRVTIATVTVLCSLKSTSLYWKSLDTVTVGFSDTFSNTSGCHCNHRWLYQQKNRQKSIVNYRPPSSPWAELPISNVQQVEHLWEQSLHALKFFFIFFEWGGKVFYGELTNEQEKRLPHIPSLWPQRISSTSCFGS